MKTRAFCTLAALSFFALLPGSAGALVPAHPFPPASVVEKAQVVVRERVVRPYGYYGRPRGYYGSRVYRGPRCTVVNQRVIRYGRVVVRTVRRCV